jgi:hypothetical protein
MKSNQNMILDLTSKERAKMFAEINDLLHETGQTIGFDKEKDIRSQVFFHCRDFTTVVILPLIQMSRVEEKLITKNQYPFIFGIDDTYSEDVFNHYLQFNRYAYLTFCMFHIESALKSILKEILGKNPDDGYYNICSNLLQKITIDSPNEKLDILLIPSFIRNSFHSNGIHTKKINGEESVSYIIKGYEFTFEKGKVVSCGGWFHIYIIMKELVSVLKEIMKSKEVQNITKIIPDQYIPY